MPAFEPATLRHRILVHFGAVYSEHCCKEQSLRLGLRWSEYFCKMCSPTVNTETIWNSDHGVCCRMSLSPPKAFGKMSFSVVS